MRGSSNLLSQRGPLEKRREREGRAAESLPLVGEGVTACSAAVTDEVDTEKVTIQVKRFLRLRRTGQSHPASLRSALVRLS